MKNTIIATARLAIAALAVLVFAGCDTLTGSNNPGGKVETPAANPGARTVLPGATVALSTATEGAEIYYTLDGNAPDKTRTKYTGPIAITRPLTLKAIGVKEGWTDSDILEAAYTVAAQDRAAKPAAAPAAGEVEPGATAALSTATEGAEIYYTLDGSAPDKTRTKYTGPIAILQALTLKAVAVKEGWTDSDILEAAYTVAAPNTAARPSASPEAGELTEGAAVTLSTATEGAEIYYTTDGSDPDRSGTKYTEAISVTGALTIRAFAVKEAMEDSGILEASYTIRAAKPSANPASGSPLKAGDRITLSTTTSGARIYYTLDNTAPTGGSALYNDTDGVVFMEAGTATLKAIAVKEGWTDSEVLEASYTVAVLLTATVFITPTAGGKTTVDSQWNGWDDEGPEQAVKLLLAQEELTAYFGVVKEAAQTIEPGEAYTGKVRVITDEETDGTTPDDELAVVAVDIEDLVFDGTDAQGKGTQTFDLVVSEDGKDPVTLTVHLELTLPQAATIYQNVAGTWTRIAAAWTQSEITTQYNNGKTNNTQTTGGATLTEGPVTDLQNAIAWVDAYAVGGDGSNLAAGTTEGYSQYRIFIKKDEKIGKVFLRFNTADYVSLELYGAGTPGVAERRIALNHNFNTTAHILKSGKVDSEHGLITLYHRENQKNKILVLGKNITIDGEDFELTATANPKSIDKTLDIRSLLYAGKNGAIIMRPYSKITGYFSKKAGWCVVYVTGDSSYYYMQGGEISGNKLSRESSFFGVIYLNSGGTNFVYTGGTITGNTRSDDGSNAPINIVVRGGSIAMDFDNL
jgi:hypothetical protein